MTHLMQIEEYPSKSLHGNRREQSIFVEQFILLDLQLLYLLLHYYHPFSGEYVELYSVPVIKSRCGRMFLVMSWCVT